MTTKIKLNQEHRDYLEWLRQSGVTNMWGAAPYVAAEFDLTHKQAADVLVQWIKSFDEVGT